MNTKLDAERKLLRSLFMLCCFVISGCVTMNKTSGGNTLEFSTLTTTPAGDPANEPSQHSQLAPVSQSTHLRSGEAEVQPFELVAQQFEAFVRWRRECTYKPKACDIDEFTILGTPFSDNFGEMMHDYVKNNIYSRPGKGERKIKIETISRDETTMTAIVHGCVFDTVVLYMRGGIYDDKIASSLSSWTMQWQNERWYWTNYEIHKKVYFENLCGA